MANIVLADNVKISSADTIEQVYLSPASGDGTLVSAFTAANNSGANASYKTYIFDSSGVLVDPVIPLKIVIRNRFDLGASIVNQMIPAGGTLRIENNIADSLLFRVTGESI